MASTNGGKEKGAANTVMRDFYQLAQDARDEWLERNANPTAIRQRVAQILDGSVVQIVTKLLGFNTAYRDSWELDHCNGRAGQSFAGQYLVDRVNGGAKEWLDKQAGELPNLPKSAVENLRANYLKSLENLLRKRLQEMAGARAAEIVAEIVGKEALDEALLRDDVELKKQEIERVLSNGALPFGEGDVTGGTA